MTRDEARARITITPASDGWVVQTPPGWDMDNEEGTYVYPTEDEARRQADTIAAVVAELTG